MPNKLPMAEADRLFQFIEGKSEHLPPFILQKYASASFLKSLDASLSILKHPFTIIPAMVQREKEKIHWCNVIYLTVQFVHYRWARIVPKERSAAAPYNFLNMFWRRNWNGWAFQLICGIISHRKIAGRAAGLKKERLNY